MTARPGRLSSPQPRPPSPTAVQTPDTNSNAKLTYRVEQQPKNHNPEPLQVNFILGRSRGAASFLVGYRSHSPQRPQHRLASCPPDAGAAACGVASLLSPEPNPVELSGALVAGPTADDSYADLRPRGDQSAVGLHHNAPLVGLLGGLLAVHVLPGECAAGQGLYQIVAVNDLP